MSAVFVAPFASVFGSSNATCAVSTLTFMFIACNASHASSRAASTRASSRVNASTRGVPPPPRTRVPRGVFARLDPLKRFRHL